MNKIFSVQIEHEQTINGFHERKFLEAETPYSNFQFFMSTMDELSAALGMSGPSGYWIADQQKKRNKAKFRVEANKYLSRLFKI